ncbi:MAG TPA: hypothetical protein VMW75_09460 [Thermoanaerobaculia bacterium]|nr:hypothetical protein [Thermoanaerobaculia bacterium]
MSWVAAEGFQRRPLVVVEDHLYHMTELLERLGGGPPLYDQLTVVCLDRPGPDTTRTVARWLAACPGLQVVAAIDPEAASASPNPAAHAAHATQPVRPAGAAHASDAAAAVASDAGAPARFRQLPPAAFTSPQRLCQTIAAALRPGGLLLQDVQLQTLAFIPPDRWWESIYLASAVRGMFAERPPACRFVSNKRGYEATFGRDLLDAGFDPRDVIDKGDLDRAVVPTLRGHLDRAFPLVLRLAAPGRLPWELRVGRAGGERDETEGQLDLVLWSLGDGAHELGGRALAAFSAASAASAAGAAARRPPRPDEPPPRPAHRRVAFRPGNQEAVTWRGLLGDRLAGGPGLAVLAVGRRLAPAGAGKPEITNIAARHLHTLRGRLADPAAIVTAHHAYRLCERLAVGLAEEARATISPGGLS